MYLCSDMGRFSDKRALFRWGVVALYLLLCVLFFAPIAAPYKLTYPLLLLTAASLWSRRPLFTLALAFSALGDYFGTTGGLLWQIGSFGVAQLCYLLFIARHCPRPTLRALGVAVVLPALLCAVAFVTITPAIKWGVLKAGVVAYAVLIGAMTTAAGLSGSALVRLGALLFMLSDFVLAHSLFVSPHSPLLFLSLYFAGQLLLWLGLQTAYKKGAE